MLGQLFLYLSFCLALFASVFACLGLVWKSRRHIESVRRALLVNFVFASVACARLVYAFLTNEFIFKYVASHSSTTLPTFYKITGLWAGQTGSLLFWFWLLTAFSAVFVFWKRNWDEIAEHALPALAVSQLFFALLLLVPGSSPFEMLPAAPVEGNGLNPLLQNPGMIFHPPTLYVGFVGFTIPFALAIGALLCGREDVKWIKKCRRWTLFSWAFLTVGIIFGAQWAYMELGWGGYWAWDPVENASLLPWLTATAFLHSIMMQEKRDILRFWNVMLITATFELCLLGTFLTRSGVVGSVHSFGQSSVGMFFLVFMALTGGAMIALTVVRNDLLRTEKGIDSAFSREGTFLTNNLVLCALTFSVLLGTLLPLITELFTGDKIAVGPAFYNRVNAPLAIILLFLTGLCPLISWRKASFANFRRNFLLPLVLSVLVVLPLAFFIDGIFALVGAFFGSFVLFTIGSELVRLVKARKLGALGPVLTNKRRYGGYLVHVGMVILFLGIAGSSLKTQVTAEKLKEGDTFQLEQYTFTFQGLSRETERNAELLKGNLRVTNGEEEVAVLSPAKAHYATEQETMKEVDIRSGFFEDVYAILLATSEETASFQVYVIPTVSWIWAGGWIMLAGSVFAFFHRWRK